MPAFGLAQGPHTLTRYDVVGEHAATPARFIRHVALHEVEHGAINHGQRVDVVHMGPPLEIDGKISAHAAGRVPLRTPEIRQIEVWIEKIRDEYIKSNVAANRRRQYVIHPPWEDYRDPTTGVRRYPRFSCAGFVLDAHRQVDVNLIDIKEEGLRLLPEVDEQTLALAYPGVSFQHLDRFGIKGRGPWRIVLAGYVLHALNRTNERIRRRPYQAKSGDERFPYA